MEHGAYSMDICEVDGENNGVSLSCTAHQIRAKVEIIGFVSRICYLDVIENSQ